MLASGWNYVRPLRDLRYTSVVQGILLRGCTYANRSYHKALKYVDIDFASSLAIEMSYSETIENLDDVSEYTRKIRPTRQGMPWLIVSPTSEPPGGDPAMQ